MQLTIDLPQSLMEQLAPMMEQTQQSLEAIVLQSILGNLPPWIDRLPKDLQAEFVGLHQASLAELVALVQSELEPSQGDRLRDDLMLKKAYAWAVLRWRGYPELGQEVLWLAQKQAGQLVLETDWIREVAIMLFQQERVSLARASAIAKLSVIDFQQLLASRNICVHYDVVEFANDLESLKSRGWL